MTSITWTLNHQNIISEPGETILQAARRMGIAIPTLCYQEGLEIYTSCMICVVEEKKSQRLLPACSAPVAQGMEIETDSQVVQESRRTTLELLLSEHIGDCYGPCQRICPAHLDIPTMLRQIAKQNWPQALQTIKQDIALPAVAGRICPAPCEKGCRRKLHDGPVSICLLKRFVADWDLAQPQPYTPPLATVTGKKVAIVGAGPMGLAAAYYLRQYGYACTIWDEHSQPGGMLRYAVPEDLLPRSVLDAEIGLIQALGVQFIFNTKIGRDRSWEELIHQYDALVLATGQRWSDDFLLQLTPALIPIANPGNAPLTIHASTLQLGNTKIFAGGSVVSSARLAIRALADGKKVACSIHDFLQTQSVQEKEEFFCRIAGVTQEHLVEALLHAALIPQASPKAGIAAGYTQEEAIEQAQRCLHCECRAVQNCQLKKLAQTYHIRPISYPASLPAVSSASSNSFHLPDSVPPATVPTVSSSDMQMTLDSKKCIRCGRCVRLSKQLDEPIGIGFQQRGYQLTIATPPHHTFDQCLTRNLHDYSQTCPVGALRYRTRRIHAHPKQS